MSTNDVLIYAEHDGGQVKKIALEVTTKAKRVAGELGGSVLAVALGPNASQTVAKLGEYGADKVFVSEDEAYVKYSIGPAASALSSIAAETKPRLIIMSATATGKDIAARVAAKTGGGIIAAALDVAVKDGDVRVLTSVFGGALDVSKAFAGDGPGIVLLRPNAVAPEAVGGAASMETIAAAIPARAMLAKIVDRVVESVGQAPLEEAVVVVAGGRGAGGTEGFALLQTLANEVGGVVGASRAAVDVGWIGYSQQIGQTGKTVKPMVYFACGISGAIQHKVGMLTSNYIIAVNKNPEAPIFQFADCCIVGDLFEVVPELLKEVKKRR